MRIGQFIEYKGYVGTIEYSPEDNVYHGRLLNTNDSINYDGTSIEELYMDYQGAVNFYIEIKKVIEEEL